MADEKTIKSDWEHFFKDGTILYSVGRIGYNDGSWYWTLYEASYYDFIRAYKAGQEDFKTYLSTEGESEEFDDNEEEFKAKLNELKSSCKYVGSANLLKKPIILKKLAEFKKEKETNTDDGKKDISVETETNLEESVEKHDTLNPKLWNEDNTLKSEVKEKIDLIVKDFLDGLKEDGIKINVKDVKLVGSNCSYNYNDKSDLDVHIVVDTKTLECPDGLYPLLYSAYRSIWNKKYDIEFYDIPVELFIETEDGEEVQEPTITEELVQEGSDNTSRYQIKRYSRFWYAIVDKKDNLYVRDENKKLILFHKAEDAEDWIKHKTDDPIVESQKNQQPLKSNGIYSVMNNKWIKKPVAADIPEVDQEAFDKLFAEWDTKYQELIAKFSEGTIEDSTVEDPIAEDSIDAIEGEPEEDSFSYEKALNMEFDSDDMPLTEGGSFKVDIYYKDKDGKPHTARYVDYSLSRHKKEEIVNTGGEVIGMDISGDDDLNEATETGATTYDALDPEIVTTIDKKVISDSKEYNEDIDSKIDYDVLKELKSNIYKVIRKYWETVFSDEWFFEDSFLLEQSSYDKNLLIVNFKARKEAYFKQDSDFENFKASLKTIPSLKLKKIHKKLVNVRFYGNAQFIRVDQITFQYTGQIVDSSTTNNKSINESKISWEDAIKDSYYSLINSLGQIPTASQVLEDVVDSYDLDIDIDIELDDPIKYNKWLSDVEHVLNTLRLEVIEESLNHINEEAVYGLFITEIDPNTGKKISSEWDDRGPIEKGTKAEMTALKPKYEDNLNVNRYGHVYKGVVRFIGNTSFEE